MKSLTGRDRAVRQSKQLRFYCGISCLTLALSLFPPSVRAGPAVRYRFKDVTQDVGLPTRPHLSWGSSWGDFDGDVDLDLFENRHVGNASLWVNQGGTFSRSHQNSMFNAVRMDRHGCAWGEADGDGRADLYCTQGANKGHGRGSNQLFIQSRSGDFVNRARALGVRNPLGRGRMVNWIDFDTDGDLDIFVGNERRTNHGNVMFRNVNSEFRSASVGVAQELPTVSSSWADWDGDGDPDLLALFDPRKHQPPRAYENVRGRFRRIRIEQVMQRAWRSAAWGDFNADGWPDLHLVNDGNSLVLRNVRGTFRVADRARIHNGRTSAWMDVENDGDLDLFVVQGASDSASVNRADFLINRRGGKFGKVRHWSFRGPRNGNGDSVSVADYDADGRQDVFITNGGTSSFGKDQSSGPSILLRNQSRGGNWIALDIEGSDKNPWGLGAEITVSTPTRRYRTQITDGVNFRMQSDVSLWHFGIGAMDRASIRVQWPGGSVDCVSVAANSVFHLVKGAFGC